MGDLFLIGKSFNPGLVDFAKIAADLGRTVIFDISDNYFEHRTQARKYRPLYVDLCRLSTKVSVTGQALFDEVLKSTGIEPTIIEDPVEGERFAPVHCIGSTPIRLGWFGHQSNIEVFTDAITDELVSIFGCAKAEFHFLTGSVETSNTFVNFSRMAKSRGMVCKLHKWEDLSLSTFFSYIDVVVLPTLHSNYFRSKSANRVSEALWAGMPVATNALIPSYSPFRKAISVNTSIGSAIGDIYSNWEYFRSEIYGAQATIERHFSVASVSKRRISHMCGD